MKDIKEMKKELASRVKQKAPSERFLTRLRGPSPTPLIEMIVDGESHLFDFSGTEPKELDQGVPNLTVEANWETMKAIWDGTLNPWTALEDGSLIVVGSHRLAHGLYRFMRKGDDVSAG